MEMEANIANELKKLEIEVGKKIFSITKENRMNFPPSPLQAKITKYLVENHGKEIYQRDLEEVMGVSKATISGALLTMEKNQIIERVASQNDARQKKIVLTSKSNDVYKEVKEVFKILNAELVKDISEEELKTFLNVINKMKSNIKCNVNI